MKAVLFFVLLPMTVYTQTDTVVIYDYPSQTESQFLPVVYDTTVTFDSTSWYMGSFNSNVATLDLTVPTSNLMFITDFTYLSRAADYYDRESYPLRTFVSLGTYLNDTFHTSCSGTLIGDRWVLTAAHCLINSTLHTWFQDTFVVVPGYDNAEPVAGIGVTEVERAYVFKSFKDGTQWDDMALLELTHPIGNIAGWVGLGFSTDSAFYEDHVFHKFSYPATTDMSHPWLTYNGDTMYYNHGLIDYFQNQSPPHDLGLLDPNTTGVPGQSGSTFLFTDNANRYLAFGMFSLSFHYRHKNLTNSQFSMFKAIMDTYTGVGKQLEQTSDLLIYPNPMTDNAYLNNTVPASDQLIIYDRLGSVVKTVSTLSGRIQIQRGELASGIYFCSLKRQGVVMATGKLVIQ